MKQVINTQAAPAAIGPYSQVAVKTLPKGALVEIELIAAPNSFEFFRT